MEALHIYRNESDKIDKLSKREITILQGKMEECNKEYQIVKKTYLSYAKSCADLKNKIEELIESKTAFENVLSVLNREVETMTPFSNREKSKAQPYNNHKIIRKNTDHMNPKKDSVNEEIKKIEKRLQKVNKDLEQVNKTMWESVS
jgi:Holliday junction resolvase